MRSSFALEVLLERYAVTLSTPKILPMMAREITVEPLEYSTILDATLNGWRWLPIGRYAIVEAALLEHVERW